jgi:hypothetical protein
MIFWPASLFQPKEILIVFVFIILLSIFSFNCLIVQHNGSKNPFFMVMRMFVKQAIWFFIVVCCLCPFLLRTEIPQLYPLSFLSMYHPINTSFSSFEAYSIDGDEALFVMRRTVLFGVVNDKTISAARQQCEASTSASDEYHCLVVSCGGKKGSSTGQIISKSERDAFCNGVNDNEYLYILAQRKFYPSC